MWISVPTPVTSSTKHIDSGSSSSPASTWKPLTGIQENRCWLIARSSPARPSMAAKSTNPRTNAAPAARQASTGPQRFAVGVDGIALVLIALATILVPVVILASWHAAEEGRRSTKTFFALVLVLETMMIGVFAATDVFLFYVFFEAMLIPMYFLIGSYGGPRRSYAAVKFLLYSLLGGLLMLASVIGLYVVSGQQLPGGGTFDFATLATLHISPGVEKWLFLGFFIAFAIKAPLFPFHTWLPDAGQLLAGHDVQA